jgi:hypothetical protein
MIGERLPAHDPDDVAFQIPGIDDDVKDDIREQLYRVVDVALDHLDTPAEMYKLRDAFIALNGLTIELKGKV